MPASCTVFGCYRTVGRNVLEDDGITPLNFFQFPRETSKTFKAWVDACRRDHLDTEDYKGRVVCSKHFDPKLIHGNRQLRPRLNPDAIPIYHLPRSSPIFEDILEIVKRSPVYEEESSEEDTKVFVPETSLQESLHPIYDIRVHNPLWSVRIFGDVVWYVHIDVKDKPVPEILHSVKVSMKKNEVKFFVGTAEIKHQKRMKIVGHFNLNVLEGFLSVLECFEGFHSTCRKEKANHLSNLINDINLLFQREVVTENTGGADDEGACEDSVLFFLKEQLKMYTSAPNGRRFHPEILRFAFIAYLYSPAAYRSIYYSGYLLIPAERTLQKYMVSMRAQPGLSHEHMSRLRLALNELEDKDKHLQLLIDEIQIYPDASFGGQVVNDLAGTGNTNVERDHAAVAKLRLVTFLIQSICGSFRDVAVFFPAKNMTAEDIKKWTLVVITGVETCGGIIEGITMDNTKTNQRLAHMFGVNLHPEVQASVCHPVDPERTLTLLFDPSHLIKCVRNDWINASGQTFSTPEGKICFTFLKKMYELESTSGHKLAGNLTSTSLAPTKSQKQSVRLAVNVISPSTRFALKHLKETNPDFRQADATISFMETMYQALCWMNSSYPGQDGRDENEDSMPFSDANDIRLRKMVDMQNWLREWNDKENEQGLATDTFHAFLVTLQGLQDIIRKLLREQNVSYVLTAKLQQDAVKERSGVNRLRAGNHSVLQSCQTETRSTSVTNQATAISSTDNSNRSSSVMPKKKWNEAPHEIKTYKRIRTAKTPLVHDLKKEPHL